MKYDDKDDVFITPKALYLKKHFKTLYLNV